MKQSKILAAFLAILVMLSAGFGILQLHADDIKLQNPTAEFYSNDFANVLSADTERAIVSLGEDTFRATQGGQIVFVTIESLGDHTIEQYANELFNKWKIGTKDKGILFILSMKEGKSRLEVGYGYEGVLTDLQSNKLLVKFSQINHKSGMDEAVLSIYQDLCSIVRGEGDSVQYPDIQETNGQNKTSFFREHPIMTAALGIIVVILILLDFMLTGGRITFFILQMVASSARRGGGGGGRNSGGGGRSGGGGSSGSF
jgi:uncharacterized protein